MEVETKDNIFDFNKLNRPATYNEAKTTSNTEDSDLAVAKDRLENIKEEVSTRTFESGAQRDSNLNKPYIHNLKGYTRQRFGYHTNLGARKYGDSNWEKGMPSSCYLESMDRHLASYMEGDRSEDHLSAIIFGAQGCMMNEKNDGIKSDHYFNLKQLNETTEQTTTKDIQLVKGT